MLEVMAVMAVLQDLQALYPAQGPIIPNPGPVQPPGSEKIVSVVGMVKWGAGVALLIGFFVGLACWAGGRWVDHQRAGRTGTMMMLCAVVGAIFYAIGYQVISQFAGA